MKNGTFLGCQRLTSINIPNSVTSIGEWAFAGCSRLYSINIPSRITKIENGTFSGCSRLTAINLPSALDSIGSKEFDSYDKGVFENCTRLTSINIPNGVRLVGKNTFKGCNELTYINIPNSVTCIGKSAFSGCSGLTSINIPSGVTSIGNSAFYDCKGLTSINLPSALDSIGSKEFDSYDKGAFENCTGMTSINIPNSVTIIGNKAFRNCRGLTSVAVSWQTPLAINNSVFEGVTLNNVKLIVPRGKKAVYRAAEVWEEFNPIVEDADYTITYSQPANGTLKVKNGTQEITSGSTVKGGTILTIEATPDQHYKLDSIRVNGKRSDKLSIMVEENTRIEAFFGKEKHSVTYVQSVGGTLTVKDGGQEVSSGSTVEYGTVLTIEAIPDQHYKLDSILINGKRSDKLSITVEENTHIEAFFGKEKYTVKYNNPYGGKLYVIKGTDIVTSGERVEYGTELTVKTAPDAGFKLKSLTLNGQTIPDNYKFAISEPVTIEVVFTSVGTGLDETSAAAGIVVYPNPVVDILRIATDTPIRTIRVFNIYGREVARATDTDRIDLSHLPAGVYTVRADGKKAKVVKK